MADDNNGAPAGDDDKDKALAAAVAKQTELLDEVKKLRAKARESDQAEADRQKAIADAEEAQARQKGDFEKIESGYKDKLSKTEGDAILWRSKYESLVIDRGLDEALSAAKVNPALAKAAHALIKAEHGVDLTDDGKATIGGKALADFVGEWAKSDTGKAFVTNGNAGGGAGGGNGGGGGSGEANPWKAGATFNLTKQGQILKSNPELAARMRAEAGIR